MLLEGKVAIVTGATRGIGRGIAERFAAEGAKLVLTGHSPDSGRAIMEWMQSHGYQAIYQPADLADRCQLETMISTCLDAYGRVDILVNNAGVHYASSFLDTPEQDLRKILDVNLLGSFTCSQLVAAQMVKQGNGGRIVVISSEAGMRGEAAGFAYGVSKFALIGMTECMAADLAAYGILVNAVSPGWVDTDMGRQAIGGMAKASGITAAELEAEALSLVPLKRMATAGEIAGAVAFLASDLASYVTGTNVLVDGGHRVGAH